MSLSNSTPGLRDAMSGYNGSNVDVIQMISLVKENPPIWDPSHPAYRKRDVKCQIWNRICSNLCPNWNYFDPQTQAEIIDDVKNGWNFLQDNYMKFLNGTEENGRIQVAYHGYLNFLRPNMLIHNTSGYIPTSAPESPQPSTSSQVTPPAQSKRRRSAPAGGQESNVQKKAPTRRPKAEPEDQWTCIGNTVAKRLRCLPESRQWSCVPAVFEVMDLYACENTIPENGSIITGIHNLRISQSSPTSAPEKRRKSKESKSSPHRSL